MSQFLRRYIRYRRVGFRRIDALHFAWMVATAGAPHAITRRLPHHS